MQGISQTLAGRAAILRLLPLSVAELCETTPIAVATLDQAPGRVIAPELDMWSTLWQGFYPRIHDKALDPQRWLADYYRTYVERDLRDVLRIMDLDTFERFVRLAAARTGQELNYSSLAADAGISHPTAKQWITALRTGYILALLPPHHANFRKRLRKQSRLHFLDTGLVCYLLGIHDPETLSRHPLRGAIFESFVVGELIKAFENSRRESRLFFWKDATGHEIDIVVDLGDRLVPIEVKSGLTVAPDAVDTLLWWMGLDGNSSNSALLVHGGEESFSMRGVTVRPWFVR